MTLDAKNLDVKSLDAKTLPWHPRRCVVVGATGGLGQAFVEALAAISGVERVYALSRSGTGPQETDSVRRGVLDLEDAGSIQSAADIIAGEGRLDLVIVATGLLHDGAGFAPEKSLRDLDQTAMARSFSVNAIGPALVAQAFLPLMAKDNKTVFAALSARVGSISDNRLGGWYSYRASKAALNQYLRTAAIEQRRRWPQCVVVGLHPGTVDTALSKPFQKNVPKDGLFTPSHSADRLLDVLDRLRPADTGHVFAYDGNRIAT